MVGKKVGKKLGETNADRPVLNARRQTILIVILGHTSNGNVDWKTEDGTRLKDL